MKKLKKLLFPFLFLITICVSLFLITACISNQKQKPIPGKIYGANVLDYGAISDSITDNSKAFQDAIAAVMKSGGGTVYVPDGPFGVKSTINLPRQVNLSMAPGTTLLALKDFSGVAVITKGLDSTKAVPSGEYGRISGGHINGNKQNIDGIRVGRAYRLEISDVWIRDALAVGISIGYKSGTGGYEVNVSNFRCEISRGTNSGPGSIGLLIDEYCDCYARNGVIIGYETGVRSNSGANYFSQIHVWGGRPIQKYCYYCGGREDTFDQCYADGPHDAKGTAYGFYVDDYFIRITNCAVLSPAPGDIVGIFVSENGENAILIGNIFIGLERQHIGKAIAGNLSSSYIFANGFNKRTDSGILNHIPAPGPNKVGTSPLMQGKI
jgi:hypothetical protein